MINRILLYIIITRVIACNMYNVKSVERGRVLAAKEKYVMRYFFFQFHFILSYIGVWNTHTGATCIYGTKLTTVLHDFQRWF